MMERKQISHLSLREHYAGLAMAGVCANASEMALDTTPLIADFACEMADDLIKRLEKDDTTEG